MEKKICIHGHFYQPSRENPWTGVIGREPSASPWHNWNERVTDECYLPNTAARILDEEGLIRLTIDTYSRISCDFGPTLLSWLERERPEVYEGVIRSFGIARRYYSGHGTAIAHPYHHLIMPLLSERDRTTEVAWGIRDFEQRFGRYPEGFWLPELAFDLETLETLSRWDIRFTILSASQASRVRAIGKAEWIPVSEQNLDTTRPYRCLLPSGNDISVFFYSGSLSRGVAFGNLLQNGERFADILRSAIPASGGLVHIATDGETYGHHRKFGDMALASCINRLDSTSPGILTVYGEFLDANPPDLDVEMIERTSWSCPHGLMRWEGGCECQAGRHPGWSHQWRGPLRDAIIWVRESLDTLFNDEASEYFYDPWKARDDLVGNGNGYPHSWVDFFRRHAARSLDQEERRRALALLEVSRQCLLMQTSCGWFFDDIADREPVQVLRHAAKALQLAREWTGTDFEPHFLEMLARIPGNRTRLSSGALVYSKCVLPSLMSPDQEAACIALLNLTGRGVFSSRMTGLNGELLACGDHFISHDLSLGEAPLHSCLLSVGRDSHIIALSFQDRKTFSDEYEELVRILKENGGQSAISAMNDMFSPHIVTLKDLPSAARQLFLQDSLRHEREGLDQSHDRLIELSMALMEEEMNASSIPRELRTTMHCAVTDRLKSIFNSSDTSLAQLEHLAALCSRLAIVIDAPTLVQASERFLLRHMMDWGREPDSIRGLDKVGRALSLVRGLGIMPPLWNLQNRILSVRDGQGGLEEQKARAGDPAACEWRRAFSSLGRELGVRVT
jgi:hypothetical protein